MLSRNDAIFSFHAPALQALGSGRPGATGPPSGRDPCTRASSPHGTGQGFVFHGPTPHEKGRSARRAHTFGLRISQRLRKGLAKTNRLPTVETILFFSNCLTALVMLPVFVTPVASMNALE